MCVGLRVILNTRGIEGMKRFIPRSLWGKAVSTILFLGAVAGILTFIVQLWPFGWSIDSGDTNGSTIVAPPSPTPTPVYTPDSPSWSLPAQYTPTSLDDLRLMLASGKSVRQSTAQAEALRDVAKYAVAMSYYGIAIEAGREIYSSSSSSEVLRDVAICAAEAKRYEEAIRAASEIYGTTVHDGTMKAIVRIQGEQEQGGAADVLDSNLSDNVSLDTAERLNCPWESTPASPPIVP